MKFKPFTPPNRILLGPGPSDVNPRVLAAMARPTIGHLDPEFIRLMDQIKELLQITFQTKNSLTFPISAPGSAGMEACIINLIEPGDKVIICENGVFGKRMTENVLRCRGTAVVVEDTWGDPVSLVKLDDTLQKHPDAKFVAFVHGETSTGALSDAEKISKLAKSRGCLTICDAVTSLGGVPVKVDEWELDAVYSGSQKCLSCPPGLSPVTFSERAVHLIKNRNTKVQSWFLDVSLLVAYWDGQAKRAYHHTAPINSLYGLHEALLILHEEGLSQSFKRHANNQIILQKRLAEFSVEFLGRAGYRLPQLNAILIPTKVKNEEAIRSSLLSQFNIEIGAGLGPLAGKIWRIGLMGHGSNEANIDKLILALRDLLPT
jgi:alanine-glyoxylate transaminase/serine-glyoxylate transaminase/serine-pyruvate transaminase